MADAYLERMGRELKCPICLSLLNSAVSLTCNHVFCNSCIEKSMKSASNCPVCKVPYRRREIRPAPHMDNLVNVYKSMEVASGINIFVTQNTASTKITGEANGIGNKYHEVQDNDKVQQGTLDEKYSKMGRRKGLKKASITNKRDCATNTRKPTFPTKKRVQVSLHPNSETQNPTEKLEQGAVSNEAQKNTILRTDISSICEKDEQNLSPFFWLREEEDIEKSSQQTDGNQIMYTPPEIPCFSDIKDSDDDEDDAFCKLSPKRGTCNQSDNADFFDSEMFDWTQRPCSPELCLSPQAMQIVEIGKHNGAHWVAEAALIDTTAGVKVNRKKREPKSLKEEPVNASKNKGYTRTSIKRVCNATEVRENKRTKKNMCPLAAVHSEMEKIASKNVQNNSGMKDKLLKLREQPGRTKKSCSEAVVQDLATENVPTQSDGLVPIGYSNEPAPIKFSPSENHGRSSDMAIKLNKRSKCSNSSKKAGAQQQILDGKVNDRKLEIQKVPDMVIRRRACEKDLNKVPKSLKKGKFSVEGIPEDNCNNILSRCNDVSAIRGQTSLELQDNRGQVETRIDPKLDKVTSTLNGSVLLKCKAPSVAVHCAFCQASEESEASGDMVHYLNGKRLDHSDKTISNAIHVHKNCAEWAPNVYFEDDTIVNIENEMSRSRRIRCSCCGLKGAALGCFEKSCRKSFHVPCARLTPECRWDYEHFVMLCPIHASCQLPNEVQKSQANQKRKSAVKSKTDTHQAKTNNGCKAHSTSQLGLQKRFKNVVLCYSALTITEKEIASEFEDLSGVAVLKNWDSTITHVIASTDENGACRRTLKFLMGVLEGKWILSVYWLKACIEAGALVDEQPYEVAVDIHGIRDGPRLGRLRLLDKQPKLFEGYKFFFMSDFAPSYKGYLQDLIIAAGGKVLTRKPVMEDQSNGSSSFSATTFIIYSLEIPDKCRQPDASSILNHRRAKAEVLATSTGSMVASNSWILNCIAGQKLQDRGE